MTQGLIIREEYVEHAEIGSGNGLETAEGTGAMGEENLGSSIDEFLEEEGTLEEAQSQAVKEVVAHRTTSLGSLPRR